MNLGNLDVFYRHLIAMYQIYTLLHEDTFDHIIQYSPSNRSSLSFFNLHKSTGFAYIIIFSFMSLTYCQDSFII